MWSVVIHEVWRFLLSIYYFPSLPNGKKTSIKFKQRDHLSPKKKKKRESNAVRKSESSTG